MNNLKKRKTQKGITLIALIITIIVLLILALVTINAVKGDGIIGQAQEAKNSYERESANENITLGGYVSIIESNLPGGNNIVSDGEADEIPGEGNTELTQQIGRDIIAEVNSTITGEPYRRTNPIIPAGFKAINTETSKWDAEGGPEVDNGLVISDGTNEFVWVPVTTTIASYGLGTSENREPDVVTGATPSETVDSASGTEYDAIESNLTLAGCTTDLNGDNIVNAYDFKIQLTNEFEAMASSANKYGGFYVGRYEMSLSSDKTAQSKYGETSADASQEDTNTWYGLYSKAKTYTKSSVQSSMIWGSQYDAMMTWMGEAAYITIGNSRNTTRITGTVETDKIKNVYDLYGNSREWTFEAHSDSSRVLRSGSYGSDWTPSMRSYFNPTSSTYSYNGSRLTLYIV